MATYSIVHDLVSGIENAPSGTAFFYLPSTLTSTIIYGDDTGTPISNPVTLDPNGRATVYLSQLTRMIVQTVGAVTVIDTVINASGDTTVKNSSTAFTGTNQKDINDSAQAAFGGQNYNYVPAIGAGGMLPKTWMTGVHRNVMAYASTTAPNINDGVTLADTAIAAAVADAAAAGGGVVYFPPGTYLISSAITLTSKNGVSLVGAGRASTVIKNNNVTGGIFSFTTCSGFRLAHFRLTHSSTSVGTAISLLTTCKNVTIDDVGLDDGTIAGTHLVGLLIKNGCSYISVINSGLYAVDGSANARAIKLDGVAFPGSFVSILNCSVGGGSLGACIGAVGGYSTVKIGNVIWDTGATGVVIDGSTYTNWTLYGSPGLGGLPTPVDLTAASVLPWVLQEGNALDGYTANVLSGTAAIPDLSKVSSGGTIRLRATTTGIATSVGTPTLTPPRGFTFRIMFFNNAGGALTAGSWAMNAVYHLSGGAISLANNDITTLSLAWDADAAVYREQGRTVTT